MSLRYSSTKLRQKVVEDSGVSPEVVHKVLDAYDNAVKQLVDAGVWVSVADLGHLVMVTRAATRRKHPQTGELIALPAKLSVVLKAPKPKKRLHEQKPIRDR